jgi:hypothetical protein
MSQVQGSSRIASQLSISTSIAVVVRSGKIKHCVVHLLIQLLIQHHPGTVCGTRPPNVSAYGLEPVSNSKINLNRSQHGNCSTKYNTSTGKSHLRIVWYLGHKD